MFCLSRETFSGSLSMCVKNTQNCDKNKNWGGREGGRERDWQCYRVLGSSPGWRLQSFKILLWELKSADAHLDLLSSRISWHFNKKLKGSEMLKHQTFIQNAIPEFCQSHPLESTVVMGQSQTDNLFPKAMYICSWCVLHSLQLVIILILVTVPTNLLVTEELVSLVFISSTSFMIFLEQWCSIYSHHTVWYRNWF